MPTIWFWRGCQGRAGRRFWLSGNLVGLTLVVAPLLSAQTTDPPFRSWRWTEGPTAPRGLGLGGAMVGLADDGSAGVSNPAGLATLPRVGEIQLGYQLESKGDLPNGDFAISRRKAATPVDLALRPSPWLGVSYQWVTLSAASSIALRDPPYGGTLKTSINGPGLGVGVRVSPFLTIGLALNALSLHIDEGSYTRDVESGKDLSVRFAGKDETALLGTLGALGTVGEMSYGLAWRWGGGVGGLRSAVDPRTRQVVDDGTSFEIRAPSVLSAGLAWRPELRRAQTFLVTAQVDYLTLGAWRPTAVPGVGFGSSDYRMRGGLEYRAGTEITIPAWGARFQVRGGWYRQQGTTPEYLGSDPAERRRFPGAGARNLWSVGGSIGWSTLFRFSVAYSGRDPSGLLVVGLAIRYPGLFP